MGRLSGFTWLDVVRRLRRFGFEFDRPGKGSREPWRHPGTGRKVPLSRHPGARPEGTLRAIHRQAGIAVEDFLKE